MKAVLIALVSFAALDGLWLGVVMRDFYRTQLAALGRVAPDGSLAPVWAAAAPVYLLLALGVALFVVPRAADASSATAAIFGAVFGLIVYGVYDLTNYATLRDYSLKLALVDIAWGTFACATATVITRYFAGRHA